MKNSFIVFIAVIFGCNTLAKDPVVPLYLEKSQFCFIFELPVELSGRYDLTQLVCVEALVVDGMTVKPVRESILVEASLEERVLPQAQKVKVGMIYNEADQERAEILSPSKNSVIWNSFKYPKRFSQMAIEVTIKLGKSEFTARGDALNSDASAINLKIIPLRK